ncbi:hypothetical protein CPLU01_05176 [Colletotrichum plurivorum]|uniref:Uncharacterized protein n=1 Tax=Colletotrichum plurivorum TaxID=2175906 RepID=A0A8H6KMM8_9PEZI|nr:hypothetical protein CPLU01_05176 [Colletotrichum plurivorum]
MSGRMKSLDASQDGLHAAYTLEFAPRRPRQRPQTATSSPSRKVGLGRETVSRICSRSRIRIAAVSQKAAYRPSCVETPVPLRVVRFSYHEASFLHFSQTRQPIMPSGLPSMVKASFTETCFRSGACAMPACTRFRTGFTPRRVSPSPIRDGTLTQHRTDAGTPTG